MLAVKGENPQLPQTDIEIYSIQEMNFFYKN